MNLDKIELGTPETAVKSCVNLLSRLFEQPEEYVACYLDLYYQVRRRWEESAADGGPMKASAPTDAEDGGRSRTPAPTDAVEASSGAARQLPQGGSQGTDGKPETAPPKKPRARETYINDAAHRAAEFKRQVRSRLMAARQAGRLTTAQILAADTEGEITEGEIWKIVNGHQCGVDVYRSLERVLNRLEAEASINA